MTEIFAERITWLLRVVCPWLVAVFAFSLAVIETINLIRVRKERKFLEKELNKRAR